MSRDILQYVQKKTTDVTVGVVFFYRFLFAIHLET